MWNRWRIRRLTHHIESLRVGLRAYADVYDAKTVDWMQRRLERLVAKRHSRSSAVQ
jgi:predicted secreted Zn-dependent protease